MEYRNVIVERDEGVGIITLNRPEVLNTISRELGRELDAAVKELEEDGGIGAIIFTGRGDRAFSAGDDVREMAQLAENSGSRFSDDEAERYVWHIASCAKRTIGAINGLAYGGGAALASSFDIRVGCEKTSFRFLGAAYGRLNSTWSLPLQIGWPLAKELLFTARTVEAREAHRLGLLNHLVACDQLMLKAIELARQIAANDPRMVQEIKELMIRNVGAEWGQMLRREQDAQRGKPSATPAASDDLTAPETSLDSSGPE